jgi:hypothetical protein
MEPLNNKQYTGLQCNVGDCQYLCLKRSEMRRHQANYHDGLAEDSPCQVKETEAGLELIHGQFYTLH